MKQCSKKSGILLRKVCYFLLVDTTADSASEAEAKCQAEGGTSTLVKSREVYDGVTAYLNEACIASGSSSRCEGWLGGTYQVGVSRLYGIIVFFKYCLLAVNRSY